MRRAITRFLGLLFLMQGCARASGPERQVRDFASRYAEAWSSQDAASVAAFFAPAGSLTINDGTPAVGREAIAAAAQGFMSAFPDMKVMMDSVVVPGPGRAVFHWTLVGTNSGPSGTGRPVHISGSEQWRLGPDGLIAESQGHFDSVEYQHQLRGE